MIEIQRLKNHDLHEKLKLLSIEERHLTHKTLLHIVEVDRRELFLKKAYSSLFEYLTKGVGFSAASAQRRIDAVRLMRKVPEVGEKIQDGSINLVQIGKLQKAFRFLKKERGLTVSLDDTKTIIDQIQNKSTQETEILIAKTFDLPVLHSEKKTPQADESVRVEMTFSKQDMKKIEQAQALLSHALKGMEIKDLLLYLTDRAIKQKTSFKEKPNKKAANSVKEEAPQKPFAKTSKESFPQASSEVNQSAFHKDFEINLLHDEQEDAAISARLRKQIFRRDLTCQYKDPETGQVCGVEHFLQVDHIHPQWAGGSHKIENLRAYCSSHNKFRYKEGI